MAPPHFLHLARPAGKGSWLVVGASLSQIQGGLLRSSRGRSRSRPRRRHAIHPRRSELAVAPGPHDNCLNQRRGRARRRGSDRRERRTTVAAAAAARDDVEVRHRLSMRSPRAQSDSFASAVAPAVGFGCRGGSMPPARDPLEQHGCSAENLAVVCSTVLVACRGRAWSLGPSRTLSRRLRLGTPPHTLSAPHLLSFETRRTKSARRGFRALLESRSSRVKGGSKRRCPAGGLAARTMPKLPLVRR